MNRNRNIVSGLLAVLLDAAANIRNLYSSGRLDRRLVLAEVEAKALAVATPALISPDYFRQMADMMNAGGLP